MSDTMDVKIITPRNVIFDGKAWAVTIPAEMGEMQALKGHITVVGRLRSGKVVVSKDQASFENFEVEDGFFRVTSDKVSILADRIPGEKEGFSKEHQ